MSDKRQIGIYDSGVGGLTVYKELYSILPCENYLYFGDTKNLPYGSKTKDQIINIAGKIFDFYAKKDIKALVMACNTTSAIAYEKLKDNYDFKIYPLIQTVAKPLSKMDINNIGVLATPATVSSAMYSKSLSLLRDDMRVFEQACPTWVQIVEDNKVDDIKSLDEIEKYLLPLLKNYPEKIILGCTHYPYLKSLLMKYVKEDIFINPSQLFAEFIANDLENNNLLNDSEDFKSVFCVSSSPESFLANSRLFYEVKQKPLLVNL